MSAKEIRKRCVFKHAEVLQRYYDQDVRLLVLWDITAIGSG